MTDLTALDRAHAAMSAAPDDDAARLRFYERLADSELFLLLSAEPEGDTLAPEVFDLGDSAYVLVFDREERLSGFVGKPAPYAALSGRAVVQMLAGQTIGLGVNLEVETSQMLIPSDAVDWLCTTLAHAPDQIEARAEEFFAPQGLPEILLTALDAKLATATGLARNAYLVRVAYEGGAQGHMLGIVDAVDGAQDALAAAVGEALRFSGLDAGSLDVGFFAASDPAAAAMAKVGLRFELPVPQEPAQIVRAAPGSDPARPPKLR